VESEIGDLFGSATVCGRCVGLSFFFEALLASSFGIFSDETIAVASSGNTPASAGELPDIEPSGNGVFQLINRTAPREAKARRHGH
jgi:hypothetical protein